MDRTETLPVWLQDAGYRTVRIGKYLNGHGEEDPQGGAARLERVVRRC